MLKELIYKYDEIKKDFPKMINAVHIAKKPRGNPQTTKKQKYKDIICAFDIETTRIEEFTFMYVWQFQWGLDTTIIGRKWSEFIELVDMINEHSNASILCFVHNLAYEWQFIRCLFEFDEDAVFLVDSRKPLKVNIDKLELRCSYRLTNMDLEHFLRSMHVENQKISGEDFDYTKIRYPDTELSELEMQYIVNDVKGLVQAIYKKNALENDSLYKMPLTSTGYVRRICKKRMRTFSKDAMLAMQPSTVDFAQAMRECFRGGNVHASRWYSNRIWEKVHSYDRVSSYPTCLVENKYPMGAWSYMDNASLDEVMNLYKRKRAVIMRVAIHNLRQKDDTWGCPYLSVSKCRNVVDPIKDNGRLLEAMYLETTITDVDFFDIILNEYEFDEISFIDVWHTRYDRLPDQIVDTVMEFYQNKTDRKNHGNDPVKKYYYDQAKALLNSIYGMMCQNFLKPAYKYTNGEYTLPELTVTEDTLSKLNRKAWLSYAWGIWCTCWARLDLYRAIKLCGDGFIYCDTDSVKFIETDTMGDFEEFNQYRKGLAEKYHAFADDPDGKRYYLGTWDDEGVYDRFITMGAKKYAYEQDGKLGVTTAGVNKKAGAKELKKLENYKEGFIFHDAGGLEAKYFDNVNYHCTIVNGHRIEVTTYVSLLPSTYELGLAQDYKKLLTDPKYYLDLIGYKS